MADVCDVAAGFEESFTKAANQKRKPEVSRSGRCNNCNAKIKKSLAFCDPDCRDDWQAIQDAKKRNGK